MSRKGMVSPWSYFAMSACCAADGDSSALPSRSLASTDWKAITSLEYFAPRKVKVLVFGNTSVEDDVVVASPLNVPNRDRAIISGHRSAAQYGQNSAPK